MTESADAALPSLEEARGWLGAELSDVHGARIGRLDGLYVDAASGEPAWLVARVGKRRGGRVFALPVGCCAGAPFGAWVALDGDLIRHAPIVDPSRPLRREHELVICSHYDIGEAVGRAAEVAGRPENEVTATPVRR